MGYVPPSPPRLFRDNEPKHWKEISSGFVSFVNADMYTSGVLYGNYGVSSAYGGQVACKKCIFCGTVYPMDYIGSCKGCGAQEYQ